MSKVIQVLAEMASDSNLHGEKAINDLLISHEINIEQSRAVITKDITSLERQLDICPDIVCIIVPAEDEEKESFNEEDESNEEQKSVING